MSSSLKKLVPESLRRMWWYATDAKWRQEFLAMRKRQQELKELQIAAFRSIWDQTNGLVVAGPFRGLAYLDASLGEYPQKLLGTYEKELWPTIEEFGRRNYSLIVDIGAAEGFYVCGLAKLLPNARVIGFEAQSACHSRIRELATRNGCQSQVEYRGLCKTSDLQNALVSNKRRLVVCDAEGAEDDLLDPSAVPALRGADILVEVHDHIRPGVGARLLERFSSTHVVETVPSDSRQLSDLPDTIKLPDDLAMAAMDESRHPENK